MTDAVSLLDTVGKVFGIVSTLGLAVLGTKFWQWRSESRKMAADAANGEATAGETLVQTAMQLMNPALVNAMGQRLSVIETWAEKEREWQGEVMAEARAHGWTLPPPPPFPRPGGGPPLAPNPT
ncbi:hypothetical protein CH302_19345 [Rhodococcus sp. 15-2388-1-1a]|uniref:hypothetical protein n=1 Tax=Nocardiaceae TaxID=85025 RepID=UPI00056B507F|nr:MULTISPECIES: hypothetical protein [Rhodococcus]OZE95097.1 hypothetical protein CH302_19345 [Rhodococcus sp. 15-2388-1-1a]